MRETSAKKVSASAAAGRVSQPEGRGPEESGTGAGFLEWVTRLVHTHRERLYRLARREGLREEDALEVPVKNVVEISTGGAPHFMLVEQEG